MCRWQIDHIGGERPPAARPIGRDHARQLPPVAQQLASGERSVSRYCLLTLRRGLEALRLDIPLHLGGRESGARGNLEGDMDRVFALG